ncbi:hypothetical protein EG68_11676 [Paragonimus skrjabini miyazakii]|uniref:Helicase superfamily 3 single-stranded DNA/RNA virus domain-containing protein n=1 Tax=Paragonimus skrjabini miyazakii TaxID=59628 RepID=A0A8S9YQV4_9TREM|nr:hypothetical protein EG68_11676 [Paragonimus skrjabini miyazakii]
MEICNKHELQHAFQLEKVSKAVVNNQQDIPELTSNSQKNPETAKRDCRKNDSRVEGPWINITKTKKTGSTPMRSIIEKYKEIRDLSKLAEEYPEVFARSYNNVLRTIDTIFHSNDRWWLYGPTGSGKSRQAQTMAQGHTAYWKNSTEWWDHYPQEEYVIIDDYAGQWRIDFLLQLLD